MTYKISNYWKNGQWNWDKVYSSNYGRYHTNFCLDFIMKNIKNVEEKPLNILDVGGGKGRFALPLLEKGYNVTINEIDPNLVEPLQKQYPEIKVIIGDFNVLNFEEKYDLIICFGTIKYMDNDIEEILKNFEKLLKPKGKLIFEMINPTSFRKKLRNSQKYTSYSSEYPPAVIEKTLSNLGFRNIKMEGFAALTPPIRHDYSFLINLASFFEKTLGLYKNPNIGGIYLTYAENKD